MFGIAKRHPEIFSKAALGERKRRLSANASVWLQDYLRNADEATPTDFRRLRGHIKKYRKIYENNYRDLRNKWHAHREVADHTELQPVVGRTNVREMQRLFVFLLKLYDSMWELLFNGRKPILRPIWHSASRMTRKSSRSILGNNVHERITAEVAHVLVNASAADRSPMLQANSNEKR
jgi:hypothetical protein